MIGRTDALDVPDEIDNTERGCGHLQGNATYVRSDVEALSSEDGEVPRFVELDEPVEFREYSGRGAIIPGYQAFPGVAFSFAYANSGNTTTPPGEVAAHFDRLRDDRLVGDHYGEMVPAQATDLLMSVGESHWPTPEAYVDECRDLGLNLRIPSSPNKEPPVINPMRTRCWVIHPSGAGDGRAGIIGYGVLTRVVHTTGADATEDDPDVSTYAEEWAETGRVDLVDAGEAIPDDEGEDEESPDADLEDFGAGE